MSNIIDKIQVSGITYDIGGGGGIPESAFTAYTASTDSRISQDEEVTAAGLNALNDRITPTVELTQAQYDALVDKDPNTYYIITDAQAGDLTNYYTKSETNTLLGGKQATLVSGTNIKTINNESILGSGNIDIQGGSTYTAGRGISIANDTISFSLPISAGTGTNSIVEGGTASRAIGTNSHAEGNSATANGEASHAEGNSATANTSYSHAEGNHTNANGASSHAEGTRTIANNQSEHASGQYNVSSKASNTFGDSGNTLFSVGNGTDNLTKHNAFEIRQNGDIYLSSGGTDIKLQDHLGGGGTVDQTIISGSTNAVAGGAVYNKIDEVEEVTARALNELNDAVSGKQDTLVSGTNIKTINNTSILGSGNIDIQGGSDINVVQTTGTSTADVMSQDAVTTQLNNKANKTAAVGGYKFGSSGNVNYLQYTNVSRSDIGNSIYYPKINGKGIFTNNSIYAQNNYNFQLVETSAITTSVTSSSTDAQVPSAKAVNDALGGLKLVKLTQAEYNALATKDSSTLYIIVN